MHPGLCMEKLDWAASPPEASGGDVVFCAHSFCANPVTLVSAVMSAFVSSLDVSIGLPGFLFVLSSRVRNPRAGHPPAMGRVTGPPICWRGKKNG